MIYYLSLGSNQGDKTANITEAIDFLQGIGEIEEVSSLYETEPVGMETGTGNFYNLVLCMQIPSSLSPIDLLREIKGFERRMGRDIAHSHNLPRIIDIDGKRYYQSIVRDISERKEAEKRIYHANRLYAVLSEVNQTIIRTPARDQLFQNICRIAIEFGEFKFAWIAIKQEGEETLTIAAFDGIAKDFSEKMRMFVHDMVAGRGKLGEAVRHGRSYLCNDIQNDPEMRQWSAERRGRKPGMPFLCSVPVQNQREGFRLPVSLFSRGVFF